MDRDKTSAYFWLQGSAVIGWWVLLMLLPSSRRLFLPVTAANDGFAALLLPDLGALALGSLVAGQLIRRGRPAGKLAAWFVAGAASYATLYTFAWAFLHRGPLLSVALMTASLAGTLFCALRAV
jgi:hypothetical protein